jgi:basic membrane protein A
VRADILTVYNSVLDDAGFNRLVLEGVRSFETQRHVRVRSMQRPGAEMFSNEELERGVAQAVSEGVRAVVILGAAYRPAVEALGRRFPELRIVIVDGDREEEGNVQSVQFRAHEASYLAGIVAANASRSGVIGFVGGLESPNIRAFGCAFAQGARAARADVRVLGRMLGNSTHAFSDPEGGARAARSMLGEGADVVFTAAGASGLGALAEVAKAGKYGIGVDDNQNGLHPGHILTSVLKRMDVAVYTALVGLHDGHWRRGLQSVGLAEGAVGLAMDQHNRALIDAATRAELESAEFAIRSGELEVIDAQVEPGRCDDLIRYPDLAQESAR